MHTLARLLYPLTLCFLKEDASDIFCGRGNFSAT
jgi:hypothetical protein